MPIIAEAHVGDVGTICEATIKDESGAIVNISAASVMTMTFKRADGTTLVKSAVFSSNGIDGKMRYVIVAGDLNSSGQWQMQAYVVLSSGAWHAVTTAFFVAPNVA